MVCSDYAAMDNAGKMEMLAELQSPTPNVKQT